MTTIDYLAFGLGGSANVDTQANWVASHAGGYGDVGFQPGLAQSAQINKVLRQSSFMTAAMANYVSQALGGMNILDDGDLAALITNLTNAMKATAAASLGSLPPQGRLTISTGVPVINSDAISQTVVYYTAYVGNQVPVWNGSQFSLLSFNADIPLTLTAAAASNSIVDVFAFSNAGVLQVGFGPVWAASGAGAGARGTGAGTTALARQNGIWTNAFPITLLNGANSYPAIPANRATYLGSILVDATAGQVSCHKSFGQSRKFGVWNAFNRVPVLLKAGDPAASWVYGTAAWRASNGNAANSLSIFTGLPEEDFLLNFVQSWNTGTTGNTANLGAMGIGYNSITSPSGKGGRAGQNFVSTQNAGFGGDMVSEYLTAPALGVNTITALENGNAGGAGSIVATTFLGAEFNMVLSALYRV